MDRLPNDVIARVFSHLSTSDLGRFMSVCRSWNTLLSVSPNLWVKVEIPAEVSFDKAHQIIKISSTRSDSTLSTVCYPALLQDYEIAEMMGLLEESRGTIRETILDFSQVLLSKPLFGQLSPIDFFRGCSQLEELYLDGLDGSDKGGKRVSTSPGILTHFSCQEVEEILDDQCHAFSNLKFFEVAATNGSASFLKVLSKCSQIEDLRLGGIDHCKIAKDLQAVLEKSFKKPRILHIGRSYHECCWNFEFCQDRLEELTIPAWIDANLFAPFKNLRRIHLKIPNHDEEDEDRRLENLQSLISHLGIHQEALAVLKLSAEEKGAPLGYSVDQVLESLRLNLVLGGSMSKFERVTHGK